MRTAIALDKTRNRKQRCFVSAKSGGKHFSVSSVLLHDLAFLKLFWIKSCSTSCEHQISFFSANLDPTASTLKVEVLGDFLSVTVCLESDFHLLNLRLVLSLLDPCIIPYRIYDASLMRNNFQNFSAQCASVCGYDVGFAFNREGKMKALRITALVCVAIVLLAYLGVQMQEAKKDREMLEKAIDKFEEARFRSFGPK